MSKVAAALPDARVLDLFAGSGALGLEALSRGAAHVTFVELGGDALKALRANIADFGVERQTRVYRGDALRFVEDLAEPMDIAFADPPYETGQAERLAAIFRQRPFARVLGIEHPRMTDLDGDETRRYGSVALTFFYHP